MAAGVALLALVLWLTPAQPVSPVRVLFIGNSLTYYNDLPAMVAGLGQSVGTPIEYETVAVPNFSLEDHWNQGEARRAIRRGGWTWVVLQQGPSALAASRVLLIEYAKRFDREIQQAGATTAMHMVWPSRARRGDFPGVSQWYAAAAAVLRATLTGREAPPEPLPGTSLLAASQLRRAAATAVSKLTAER